MALQCASSQILIRKSGSFLKFANRDYMSPRTRLPLRLGKAPPFILTTSASIDKVYENESEGIVCYKDESTGEIICEGYDEGPRLQRIPAPTFPPSCIQRGINKKERRMAIAISKMMTISKPMQAEYDEDLTYI
ncbi:uncharacterized protein LOC129288673 isoform X4 [Prosopis cineraria]|uniref:uncharacterized protein LOC129288673 isoform X4 n=1 Tax=Prosopis cineraria TaxID=364024 RepID=UPI00240F7CB3|nr:uncharacterized protein LOC129288673 isoform X4 [Prosopis cineraria]